MPGEVSHLRRVSAERPLQLRKGYKYRLVEIGDEHIFKLKIQKGTWLGDRESHFFFFFLPDDINLDLRAFLHSRDCAIEMCTASARRKTGEKGMFFRVGRGTRVPRLGYQKQQKSGKRVSKLQCQSPKRVGKSYLWHCAQWDTAKGGRIHPITHDDHKTFSFQVLIENKCLYV